MRSCESEAQAEDVPEGSSALAKRGRFCIYRDSSFHVSFPFCIVTVTLRIRAKRGFILQLMRFMLRDVGRSLRYLAFCAFMVSLCCMCLSTIMGTWFQAAFFVGVEHAFRLQHTRA